MNPMLNAAVTYARRGYSVLPLHNPLSPHCCSCKDQEECKHIGKHPRTAHGVNDATDDESRVREWWKCWPNANIGIATGARSNLVVVDADNEDAWSLLCKLLPRDSSLESLEISDTGPVLQLFFRYPGTRVPNKPLANGLDIRGDGGYVVVPPSLHPSLSCYRFEGGRIPDPSNLPLFPNALLKFQSREQPSPEKLQGQKQPSPNRVPAKTIIPQGSRTPTLASLAGTMRNREMTQEAIQAALLEENRMRCVPPLSEEEVLTIARSYGRYPAGKTTPGIRLDTGGAQAKVELRFRTLREVARDVPSTPPWIAAPWIAAGAITELDGKVKSAGKTTFLTHLSSSVVDGLPFMGRPTKKTAVVYLTEQPPVSFMEAAKLAGLVKKDKLQSLILAGHHWCSLGRDRVCCCQPMRTLERQAADHRYDRSIYGDFRRH